MKYTIEFDADKLIKDLMENYPEAGSGNSLRCIDWDYSKAWYHFWDTEVKKPTENDSVIKPSVETLELRMSGEVKNAVTYHVTLPALRKGLKLILEAMRKGELPGVAKYVMRDFTDPCNWDSIAHDCLVQYSIFGKLIYG